MKQCHVCVHRLFFSATVIFVVYIPLPLLSLLAVVVVVAAVGVYVFTFRHVLDFFLHSYQVVSFNNVRLDI